MKPTALFALFLSLSLVGHSQGWLQCLFTAKNAVKVDTVGNLPPVVEGTSSLFFLNGQFWTCNDHGRLTLFAIDTVSADIIDSVDAGVTIYDMEEVTQDGHYIYFGDMGDNNGVRDDLHVLRLSKDDFSARRFVFDTIGFYYPERTDSTARDFDCEAFVATDTALIFFTKQWIGGGTDCYSVPNRPGRWPAQRLFSLATDGMVTGACYLPQHRLLALCGYNALCIPFIFLSYGFEGTAFGNGTQQRVSLSLGIGCQTEGIATADGLHYYLTCERLDRYGISNSAQLFSIDLSDILDNYLNPAEAIGTPAGHGRLYVYPNPTHGQLHLPAHGLKRVEVIDRMGRKLLVSHDSEHIDIGHLPDGCYLLCLNLANGTAETIRVVKR